MWAMAMMLMDVSSESENFVFMTAAHKNFFLCLPASFFLSFRKLLHIIVFRWERIREREGRRTLSGRCVETSEFFFAAISNRPQICRVGEKVNEERDSILPHETCKELICSERWVKAQQANVGKHNLVEGLSMENILMEHILMEKIFLEHNWVEHILVENKLMEHICMENILMEIKLMERI
jgi:hypothetical protein